MSPRLRIIGLLLGALLVFALRQFGPPASPAADKAKAVTVEQNAKAQSLKAPPTRQTWGNPASLADHFARHGADFGAKDADDYARLAWELHERAKAGRVRVKVAEDGVWRVYDPQSGAFAAYNRDGTTKTFFKPDSPGYFDRQPGRPLLR